MKRKLIIWIALCLAAVIPFCALADAPAANAGNPLSFSVETLDGRSLDSSCLKDYDLIMVNYWAEWCPPCVAELPDLAQIHKNYKNVLVLGAFVGSDPETGLNIAKDAGVTYPVFVATSSIRNYLQIEDDGMYYIPQTCFFNSRGYQLGTAYVGSGSYEYWSAIVDELLENADPDPVGKPEITGQPESVTVNEGKKASFSVTAEGEDLEYQWYYRTSPSGAWKKISSKGTSATYTLTAKAKHNGYQYRCLVQNAGGEAYSDAAELTVIAKPVITTQPASKTVQEGKKVTFKVKAKGENLKYQWYYRTSATGTWKKVTSKGTSASLTITVKAKQNGYQYRCLVKNAAGKVYSKAAKLKVK